MFVFNSFVDFFADSPEKEMRVEIESSPHRFIDSPPEDIEVVQEEMEGSQVAQEEGEDRGVVQEEVVVMQVAQKERMVMQGQERLVFVIFNDSIFG